MGIYSVAMEEITLHTGLSPTAFFTIAALMAIVYKTVSSMFVSPEDFNKPPIAMSVAGKTSLSDSYFPQSNVVVQLGDMTEKELSGYNGSDPDKPLLISVRGQIYNVSSSRNFYGPGGAYSMFTGKEVSRAFALLSFKPEDMNSNLEGLGEDELQVLEDWEDKFIEKYAKVGRLVVTQVEQGTDETLKPEDKHKDV